MYPSNQHHDLVSFPPNTVSLFLLQTCVSSDFQLFGHKAQTPCLDSDQQTVHESLLQEESRKQKVPIATVSASPQGPCYCVTHLTYSCDSGGPQQCSPSKRQHHLYMCQHPALQPPPSSFETSTAPWRFTTCNSFCMLRSALSKTMLFVNKSHNHLRHIKNMLITHFQLRNKRNIEKMGYKGCGENRLIDNWFF